MPNVNIYVKETTWSNILILAKNDHTRAVGIAREVIEEKYGGKK